MLWIITQDKQSVISVTEVTISGKKIQGIGTTGLNEWGKLLGKYDSKERAESIVEEIYRTLAENDRFSITYTMPRD
ncbi:hypothetical protein JCM19046_1565 [Bacillus sp. JCM 19046]|nr:hypothetical protein JCM19045_146 [Bacillus sp. JCM 19045]GAF17086.1 hypothetical protein JCM19046_1565 [Bacillus sp. JCM 19046]